MQPLNIPKNQGEQGIAMLYILVGIVIFLGGMAAMFSNFRFASDSNHRTIDGIDGTNGSRYVDQMIADDQLCAQTDFLDGISGWVIGGVSSPKILKDSGTFVDYAKIGIPKLLWPSPEYTGKGRGVAITGGAHLAGNAVFKSLVFQQAPQQERPVVTTTAGGKSFIRIPVDVKTKGTIEGTPVLFDGYIPTFIELDPADPTKAVSCYRSVSSRSLCLDLGGGI